MDIGIPLLLIIIAIIPIAGLIISYRKRGFLQLGLILFFLLTSLGGCSYFWRHFDIPAYGAGNEHTIGLGIFIIAGIFAIVTSIRMILIRNKYNCRTRR